MFCFTCNCSKYNCAADTCSGNDFTYLQLDAPNIYIIVYGPHQFLKLCPVLQKKITRLS